MVVYQPLAQLAGLTQQSNPLGTGTVAFQNQQITPAQLAAFQASRNPTEPANYQQAQQPFVNDDARQTQQPTADKPITQAAQVQQQQAQTPGTQEGISQLPPMPQIPQSTPQYQPLQQLLQQLTQQWQNQGQPGGGPWTPGAGWSTGSNANNPTTLPLGAATWSPGNILQQIPSG